MRTIYGILLAGGLAIFAAACSDGSTQTTGSGGSGGAGASGAAGGGGSGASGGQGGMGGQGGQGATTTGPGGSGGSLPMHPGVLVDDGLIARYYLDEAAMGQMPTEAVDAAPDPLNLQLTYIPEMTYIADADGNRGLRFNVAELDGRASAAVDGSKLVSALQTSKTGTIEMVIDVEGVSSSTSRLSHIGFDSETGRFTLSTYTTTRLLLRLNNQTSGEVAIDLDSAGRIVVHAVLDTTQAVAADRARIYVNGGQLPNLEDTPPLLDEVIDLGTGRHYVIGNREIGSRTIQGTIYYSALYSTAFSAEQVLQNATLLESTDDTPGN